MAVRKAQARLARLSKAVSGPPQAALPIHYVGPGGAGRGVTPDCAGGSGRYVGMRGPGRAGPDIAVGCHGLKGLSARAGA